MQSYATKVVVADDDMEANLRLILKIVQEALEVNAKRRGYRYAHRQEVQTQHQTKSAA